MSLAKDVKFCMKLNRLKDFITSPSGLFLIIQMAAIIYLLRQGLKENK